jgi:hypothetical protein
MPTHKVILASPPDRDKLVAMIDFEDEQWAEVNQESGSLTIEVYPRRDGKPWVFDFDSVVIALERAKSRLVGG